MEILLRLGEMTLKSKRSRKRFTKILIENIIDALRSNGYSDFEVINLWSRILVKLPDGDEGVDKVFRRIFGIVGFVYVVSKKFSSFDEIISYAEDIYRDAVRDRVFAVKTRREGKHNFTSIDVNKELGKRLLKYGKKVNLKDPEVWVKLEIRDDMVYYYLKEYKAYGGLPVRSGGRVISLISGGFDSAIASWYALKRGLEVHYFHALLGDMNYLKKVLRVAKFIADNWSYGYFPKIYVADYRELSEQIREKVREDYRIVVLKRFMYRGAEYIADKLKADSLITGESLGQVSSQTLRNLRVSEEAVSIPINRPLFGFDKEEIMRLARDIGTYELSKEVYEVCALTERRPILHASREVVRREEEKIDFTVFEESLKNIIEYDLRRMDINDIKTISGYALEYSELPKDSLIIDIRTPEEYKEYHIPGSINIPQDGIYREINRFKDRKIVIVCSKGLSSQKIVKDLRERGIEAYYLIGGIRSCRRI